MVFWFSFYLNKQLIHIKQATCRCLDNFPHFDKLLPKWLQHNEKNVAESSPIFAFFPPLFGINATSQDRNDLRTKLWSHDCFSWFVNTWVHRGGGSSSSVNTQEWGYCQLFFLSFFSPWLVAKKAMHKCVWGQGLWSGVGGVSEVGSARC